MLHWLRAHHASWPPMVTVLLLTISNVFMTFAWYGHLKFKSAPLWIAIGVSWLIAFVEYCFQVPANRIGHQYFSASQLKIMQEVITLLVFGLFSVLYLGETPRWNEVLGFLLIAMAVVVVFVLNPRPRAAAPTERAGQSSTIDSSKPAP